MFFLFAYLVGYYEISFRKALKVSGRYVKGRLSLFSLSRQGDVAIGYVLSFQKRRLFAELQREGISPVSVTLKGLPQFLYLRRYRVGVFLGVTVGILLSVLSGQYIWQIEVVGNETLTDEEVLFLLSTEGVYEGAPIQTIDALAVANRLCEKSPLIAFIGVNIVGNRVEAMVLEHKDKGVPLADDTPSNIVAEKNGVIVSVVLEAGVSKLKAGDTVSKGELLISGVNLLRNEKYHYQRAKGVVLAETLNEISLSQPLYRYDKEYTGRFFEEKTLIFFTKSKKLSKECGNLPLTCDRIEKRERVMLFGRVPLPLWIKTVSYREFIPVEVPLSEEEAIRLAREKILTGLADTPLVSYREDITKTDDSVTLTVIYRAIEDIAKEYPLFDLP